jgi:hypothetical protein
MYVSETWTLIQSGDKQLCTFEREISRKLYDPVQDKEWKSKYNQELYQLYRSQDVINTMKVGRLRWTESLPRIGKSGSGLGQVASTCRFGNDASGSVN